MFTNFHNAQKIGLFLDLMVNEFYLLDFIASWTRGSQEDLQGTWFMAKTSDPFQALAYGFNSFNYETPYCHWTSLTIIESSLIAALIMHLFLR